MTAPSGYNPTSTQTPEQQSALQNFLSLIGGQGGEGFQAALSNLMGILSGSPESFESMEAPIMRQFQEETIPMLQERITNLGAGGGRSGAQARILGGAGEKLQEGLAAQRSQLQQNAIQQLLNTFLQGSNIGLGTQTMGGFQEQPQSFWNRLGKGIGGAGKGAMAGLPFGPGGVALGGIGGGFSSFFS